MGISENLTSILFLFFLTILSSELVKKIRYFKLVGDTVISFCIGLIISLVYPELFYNLSEIYFSLILFALLLYLFSSNILSWINLSSDSLLSFFSVVLLVIVISVVVGTVVDSFYLNSNFETSRGITGISSVLIGSLINLISVSESILIDRLLMLNIHLSNIIISSIYFIFVMIFCNSNFFSFLNNDKVTFLEVEFSNEIKEKGEPSNLKQNIVFLIGIIFVYFLYSINIPPLFKILCITTIGAIMSIPINKMGKVNLDHEGNLILSSYFIILGMSLFSGGGEIVFNVSLYFISLIINILSIISIFTFAYFKKLNKDLILMSTFACFFGPPFVIPLSKRL
jgi:hypothetical protein